jgi:hypothetical protein
VDTRVKFLEVDGSAVTGGGHEEEKGIAGHGHSLERVNAHENIEKGKLPLHRILGRS